MMPAKKLSKRQEALAMKKQTEATKKSTLLKERSEPLKKSSEQLKASEEPVKENFRRDKSKQSVPKVPSGDLFTKQNLDDLGKSFVAKYQVLSDATNAQKISGNSAGLKFI